MTSGKWKYTNADVEPPQSSQMREKKYKPSQNRHEKPIVYPNPTLSIIRLVHPHSRQLSRTTRQGQTPPQLL